MLQVVPTPPFFASGLLEQIALAGGGYPYLTVNAYNAWALVPSDLGISLAAIGPVGLRRLDDAGRPAAGPGSSQFGAVPRSSSARSC